MNETTPTSENPLSQETPKPALAPAPTNEPEKKEPAPEPAPNPLRPDGTTEEPEWRKEIPEEYRDYQPVKNAKSIGDIVKSLVHAQSMVGKDKIVLPDKNATEAEWEEVYNKLGRPEAEDKYELKPNPEVGLDDDMVNKFKGVAFKSGLTQAQAEGLLSWYADNNKEAAEGINKSSEAKIKADIDSLRKEWGSSFDQAIKQAQAGARYYEEQVPELKDLFNIPEVGSHPGMLKFMKIVGERVSEGKLEGGGEMRNFGLTPAEAKEKANKIIGNTDYEKNPYYNTSHPDHDRSVQEVQELMRVSASQKTEGSVF